jgi:hypothetical protein
MDISDIVVESLIKAASTETVKRGFDAISTGLRGVFDRGNRAEIKEFIRQQELIEPVAKLAKETIENSYVLPFQSPNLAKPQHKVEFFNQIVSFGFNLCGQHNMDVMLPGSFVGTDTISLFSVDDGQPNVSLEKLAVNFGGYASAGSLCIIPAGNNNPIELCDAFKAHVIAKRQDTEAYISAANLKNYRNRYFRLEKISAGSVYYSLSLKISNEHKAELGFKNMAEDSLLMKDWYNGINMMLQYAKGLPNIEILPTEEGLKLIELADKLKDFYS